MRSENEFIYLVEEKIAARTAHRPMRDRRLMLIAATAALLTVLVCAGAALTRGRGEIGPSLDTGVAELYYPEADPPPVPWSQTWGGGEYSLNSCEPLPLEAGDVGAALDDSLYTLAGVSTDYFILLHHDDAYWGYVNYTYAPATLGDLITDLNLAEYLELGPLHTKVDGRDWRIEGLDPARLWEILFAVPSSAPQRLTVHVDPEAIVREAEASGAMVTPPYDPTGQYLFDRTIVADVSVSISLPKLGFAHIVISAAHEDDGDWLYTNLLAHGNYFAAPGVVDALLAYARAAGQWEDITVGDFEIPVGIPE